MVHATYCPLGVLKQLGSIFSAPATGVGAGVAGGLPGVGELGCGFAEAALVLGVGAGGVPGDWAHC